MNASIFGDNNIVAIADNGSTVTIGLAGPGGLTQARRYNLFGDRNGIRARAAVWALDDLRRIMSGNPR